MFNLHSPLCFVLHVASCCHILLVPARLRIICSKRKYTRAVDIHLTKYEKKLVTVFTRTKAELTLQYTLYDKQANEA